MDLTYNQCEFKSAYSDYFEYKENDYKWLDYIRTIANQNNNNLNSYYLSNFPNTLPLNLNIWDIVFYLLSGKKVIISDWKDVEKQIKNCLFKKNNWPIYFNDFVKDIQEYQTRRLISNKYDDEGVFLIKHFIKDKIVRGIICDETMLYNYLKDELMKFERDFTNYLSKEIEKNDYQVQSKKLLTLLADNKLDDIVEISSFNYTKLIPDDLDIPFANLNGDLTNAIFGIDNSEINEKDDMRKIFTKQYIEGLNFLSAKMKKE